MRHESYGGYVSIDFLYALAFIAFLQYGQSQLEKRKQELTIKCQRQKEEDAAALADEEKDYVERIAQEYRYFEFVNTIRLLSRELFTRINPEKGGAHRVDSVLQELRNKLLFFNESFCSRFLNEEIRNAEFYDEGSALRHLATVKELFATHIALYWMAVKHTHGSLKGSRLSEDEQNKVEFVRSSVKSLLTHYDLLTQVATIANEIAAQERAQQYSAVDLQSVLDTFETDNSPAADVAKLQRLQKVYLLVHKYFMQKAGNYDLPFEIAQQDGDNGFLFNNEVKNAPGNRSVELGNSFIRDNQVSAKKDGRKDFVQIAHGEDRRDNADFHSEDSQANIDDREDLLKDDAEEDFAYLKHQLSLPQAPRDWRLEHSSETLRIYRKVNHNHHAHWSHIVLRSVAQLDHIPKHIVFKALAEINLRAKWDHGLGQIEQLEHIKEKDQTFFRINVNVPQHMQAREAVLIRKVLRDFPQVHQSAIV